MSYPFRPRANYVANRRPDERWVDDPGGVGRRITKEIVVCPTCSVSTLG